MAKIFSPPTEVGEKPDFSLYHTKGFREFQVLTEAWIQKVRDFAKTNGKGEFRGEIVRFPVADGYAQYVVFSTGRSVTLIHLPVYDGWQFQYAHRMTTADIKEQVRRDK